MHLVKKNEAIRRFRDDECNKIKRMIPKRIRLNEKAKQLGITPEYLFLCLSIKEIGIYSSKRRTVVASTIPHLREERLKEIEIPILDKETITEITNLVKEAFKLKDEKKRLIADVRETMDGYFEV